MDIEIENNTDHPRKIGRKWKHPVPTMKVGDVLKIKAVDCDASTLRNRLYVSANQFKKTRNLYEHEYHSWTGLGEDGYTYAYLQRVR